MSTVETAAVEMVLKPDQQRIHSLLSETILLLCKSGLHFDTEFSVEALIGITVDRGDVFLVSIRETVAPQAADQLTSCKVSSHRQGSTTQARRRQSGGGAQSKSPSFSQSAQSAMSPANLDSLNDSYTSQRGRDVCKSEYLPASERNGSKYDLTRKEALESRTSNDSVPRRKHGEFRAERDSLEKETLTSNADTVVTEYYSLVDEDDVCGQKLEEQSDDLVEADAPLAMQHRFLQQYDEVRINIYLFVFSPVRLFFCLLICLSLSACRSMSNAIYY